MEALCSLSSVHSVSQWPTCLDRAALDATVLSYRCRCCVEPLMAHSSREGQTAVAICSEVCDAWVAPVLHVYARVR